MWRSDAEGAPVADPLGIFPDVGAGQSGVVNGPGNTCGYVYDGLDRQIQVVCDLRVGGVGSGVIDTSNPTNPDGQIRLGYGFDGNSRLVRIVDDNGNVTSFGYDALDRQVSRTNADGEVFSTTYDRDSNVRTVTDPNGTVVTKSYDALNRLVATSVARGVGVGGTTAEAFAYDGLSRLTACSDDNGALAATQVCERVYDSLGRTLEERLNGLPVSTVWSGDSKRVACVYPGGRTVTNTFDAVDRVKSVSDQVGLLAESDWIGPGYRELERRLGNGTRRSWLDATGTVAEGYDSVKRVVRERVYLPGGGVLVDREYGYNRASVRTSEVRHDWGGQSDGYVYDSAYRIVQTNLDQAGVGSDPVRDVASIGYVLDGVGNRREVTKTDRGGVASTEAVSVNVMNEYEAVGATAYSHDDNGNRTSDGSRAYVWDYKNRLVGVLQQGSGIPVAVYRYHADNRRAEKQVYDSGGTLTRTTAYYYDGWQVCEERNGSGATEATYVWSPVYVDELISVERSAASPEGAGRFWAHQNVRYDVVAVTDAAGGVVERRRFDDFGGAEFVDAFGAVSSSSPGGFVYGFQGRRLDQETGLLYFRNRFYDPVLGRFLQRDPVWDAGNVGGWYSFARSAPASHMDPLGTFGITTAEEILAAAEALEAGAATGAAGPALVATAAVLAGVAADLGNLALEDAYGGPPLPRGGRYEDVTPEQAKVDAIQTEVWRYKQVQQRLRELEGRLAKIRGGPKAAKSWLDRETTRLGRLPSDEEVEEFAAQVPASDAQNLRDLVERVRCNLLEDDEHDGKHYHHIFPRQFGHWFEERYAGFDIDDYTIPIPVKTHTAVHLGGFGEGAPYPPGGWWNAEIMQFINDAEHTLGRPATASELPSLGMAFVVHRGLGEYLPPVRYPGRPRNWRNHTPPGDWID